tara:strand:+ start:275 stop:466 length:192 start_codon:yes stop_codon:yes gene_type:complete
MLKKVFKTLEKTGEREKGIELRECKAHGNNISIYRDALMRESLMQVTCNNAFRDGLGKKGYPR